MTAVQYLVKALNLDALMEFEHVAETIEKANQMYKYQIMDAHLDGKENVIMIINERIPMPGPVDAIKRIKSGICKNTDAETYYKNTYESNT
jgi:hypothetical protein